MTVRPSGICTALYICPKCPYKTYQAPSTPKYKSYVAHQCPNNSHKETQLKEQKTS